MGESPEWQRVKYAEGGGGAGEGMATKFLFQISRITKGKFKFRDITAYNTKTAC